MQPPFLRATARAFANIALAKYWGKADISLNIPAVPSVSVTLGALSTTTTVSFHDGLGCNEVTINDAPAQGRSYSRVSDLIDRVRDAAGVSTFARVVSTNNFPTASGLASSASGFAALCLAAVKASRLDWDLARISALARSCSASAARSLYGGFVRLDAGVEGCSELSATQIAPASHWPLHVVIAIVSGKPKKLASTDGMNLTAATSAYYDAWVRLCPSIADAVEQAIRDRAFDVLGELTERSAMSMHALAMASTPPILYFEPATIGVLHAVWAMRSQGLQAYATMDAGPNVKVLTTAQDSTKVAQILGHVAGVQGVIDSPLGQDACTFDDAADVSHEELK